MCDNEQALCRTRASTEFVAFIGAVAAATVWLFPISPAEAEDGPAAEASDSEPGGTSTSRSNNPASGQSVTPSGPVGQPANPLQGCIESAGDALGGPPGQISPFSRGVSLHDQEQAVKQYCEANLMYRRGRHREAASLYKEAIELWEHPVFLYNLARAQFKLAREPVEIYNTLEKATRYGEEYLGKKAYEEAREHMTVVQQQVARVIVRCDTPGAKVVFNGRVMPARDEQDQPLSQWKLVLPPGTYQIRAEKLGLEPEEWNVTAMQGEETPVVLVLKRKEVSDEFSRPWLWAAVGVGVAGLLAGGAAHWKADQVFGRYNRLFGMDCPSGCRKEDEKRGEELRTTRKRAERWRLGSGLGYAVGSALLVTGTSLLFMNGENITYVPVLSQSGSERARISPVIGADGEFGVTASFQF